MIQNMNFNRIKMTPFLFDIKEQHRIAYRTQEPREPTVMNMLIVG